MTVFRYTYQNVLQFSKRWFVNQPNFATMLVLRFLEGARPGAWLEMWTIGLNCAWNPLIWRFLRKWCRTQQVWTSMPLKHLPNTMFRCSCIWESSVVPPVGGGGGGQACLMACSPWTWRWRGLIGPAQCHVPKGAHALGVIFAFSGPAGDFKVL